MFVFIPVNTAESARKVEADDFDMERYPAPLPMGEFGTMHLQIGFDLRVNERATALATHQLGTHTRLAASVILETSDAQGMQIIAADQLSWSAPSRQDGIKDWLVARHKQLLHDYFPADYPNREKVAWNAIFKDLSDVLAELHPDTFHDEVEVTVVTVELPPM